VELSSSLGDRIFRVGDRVRIETSSETVVIVPVL
jgi:small-conductance mechanosensitive channel